MDEAQDNSTNEPKTGGSGSGRIVGVILALIVAGALVFFLLSK